MTYSAPPPSIADEITVEIRTHGIDVQLDRIAAVLAGFLSCGDSTVVLAANADGKSFTLAAIDCNYEELRRRVAFEPELEMTVRHDERLDEIDPFKLIASVKSTFDEALALQGAGESDEDQ